jgi:predicted ATPase/DNA-binding XRE family transcriptional regulator
MEEHSFGYWLRRKRKTLDLTQEVLADRVGCSVALIRKMESEERRPSAQIAERLAEILNIPPGEYKDFLRFARGDLKTAPVETDDDLRWRAFAKLPRSNIPATTTSLVAREKEIADIRKYLEQDDIRLVTLIGPPGIGKTRLSIEAARMALPDFPDGAFFVALAPLDNPGLIAQTIAQSLGFVGATNLPVEEQLKQGIGDRHMLIVMDNCEHLVEDVARLAFGLLSGCPRLTILATSREVLRVPGEWIYAVPAFEVPNENLLGDVKTAYAFPALNLFAERARAVQSGFALSVENLTAVSAICKKLDGLPLAIELIAARTRSMSPQVLLERLDNQFILTADGMRTMPARHKTLNNAIGWSYNLLSSDEQKLFAYLSVYSGGFTLDMAEGMFANSFTQRVVSDLAISLFDKSLLQHISHESDEMRYAMLVTIQEFARNRLREMGEETEKRNQHLSYFLDLAGQADKELRGANQLGWLRRLRGAVDNLRAAFDWAIDTNQTEPALRLALRLYWFWFLSGNHTEGRQWLHRVLEMPDTPLHPAAHAEALTQLAHQTLLQIGPNEARPFAEQALAISRANVDKHNTAGALIQLGTVLQLEGNFAEARAAWEESKLLFREVDDKWGYAIAFSLSTFLYMQNDNETALLLAEQSLQLFTDLGDRHFEAVMRRTIGILQGRLGDIIAGAENLRQALRLVRQLNSTYFIRYILWGLAEVMSIDGNHFRAVILYWAGRNVSSSIGAWRQLDEPVFERALAPCRAVLSESEFAAAVEEGRAMTIEQAINYALSMDS